METIVENLWTPNADSMRDAQRYHKISEGWNDDGREPSQLMGVNSRVDG